MPLVNVLGLASGIAMVLFGVISWPIAHRKLDDEPTFVIALSELALIYGGFNQVLTALAA